MTETTPPGPSSPADRLLRWLGWAALLGLGIGLVTGIVMIAG